VKGLRWTSLVFLIGFHLYPALLRAEEGILVVHVKDSQDHPIGGMQIGVEGDGGSVITGGDGKARIRLAKQTKEKSWVSLQIVKSPPGKDYVIVSPWDKWAIVPPFDNESQNFVEIVVVQRGDRAALENSAVLTALVTKINSANAPKTAVAIPQDPQANIAAVAKQYDLTPEELDKAIRAWGAKVTDLEQAGQAALYELNYPKASDAFSKSLKEREKLLASDQKAVAESAFFLGTSLFAEGKYAESVAAYERCLQLRPDDTEVLVALALSLQLAGRYKAAEPLYRRALSIDGKMLGPDHPTVARDLNQLGTLIHAEGDYKAAEELFRRALAIEKKTLSPASPDVASALCNLGSVFMEMGDYSAAEPLFRQALAIDEKSLGPNDPYTGKALVDLAFLLDAEKDYQAAEPLFRRALAIDEKALGTDHPETAKAISALGSLLRDKGDYKAAEELFRRALAIIESRLGPDHPDTATSLDTLAELCVREGHLDEADPLFRRALAIDEKALGTDHPIVATDLNNVAFVLQHEGDYVTAALLYRRALAIDEKTLGPNDIRTQRIRLNMGTLPSKDSSQKTPN
jgi:tetratricopeptide (TPR) repeat protein